MNNQHEFARECDIAIASKSIKQIQICIDRLESKLSEQSDLTKCWKQYILGNLYIAISAIKEECMDDIGTSMNALLALNYYKNSYELATKNNSPIKLEIQANLAKSLMKFGLCIEAMPLFTIDFLTDGDSPFVSSRGSLQEGTDFLASGV